MRAARLLFVIAGFHRQHFFARRKLGRIIVYTHNTDRVHMYTYCYIYTCARDIIFSCFTRGRMGWKIQVHAVFSRYIIYIRQSNISPASGGGGAHTRVNLIIALRCSLVCFRVMHFNAAREKAYVCVCNILLFCKHVGPLGFATLLLLLNICILRLLISRCVLFSYCPRGMHSETARRWGRYYTPQKCGYCFVIG